MKLFKPLLIGLIGIALVCPARASRDFNGTSDYLEVSSAVVTAYPFTLACWFKADSATVSGMLLSLGNSGSSNNWHYLSANGNVAGDPVRVGTRDSASATSIADTSTGYTVGTWHHACGVFASATSRTAYIDGGSAGTNTTSRTPTVDRTTIGALNISGTPGNFFDGPIAEAAIWNVALTAAEVNALRRGYSPFLIRPQNLVFYAPLVRGLVEVRGGVSLTASGTTAADHPRVYQ